MSRTDAHAPYWTWAPWYEPNHSISCEFYVHRTWQRNWERMPCNLPKRPVRHAAHRPHRWVHLCTWEPIWPAWREVRWLMHGHQPRWFVKHVGHAPERVRERDQLGKMVKQYNATGELEDADFANYQSRHAARWLWD